MRACKCLARREAGADTLVVMRTFSARETEWLKELDGIELASFHQRFWAFVIDWVLVWVTFSALAMLSIGVYLGVRKIEGKPMPAAIHFMQGTETITEKKIDGVDVRVQKNASERGSEAEKLVNDIVVPILYFGILLWKGKGQTPGKKIMKIRVVSIMHRHLSFWHSVERALGYGAAALEAGFGFVQFFIHPYRRCAQDRLAETIVVKEHSYQALQHRLSHPLVPDK